MSIREDIRLHAATEDKPCLNWLLDRYHWASQWSFVAKFDPVRYGPLSYQVNRVWVPTPEGLALYEYDKITTPKSNAL